MGNDSEGKEAKLVLKAIDGFRAAAVEIANLFAEKHDLPKYDGKDTYFVDEFGNVCIFGDYSFDMQTMIESLAEDLPAEELFVWYNYTLEYSEIFGTTGGCPNFYNWCKGCPRVELAPIMEKKRELEKLIAEAKEIF